MRKGNILMRKGVGHTAFRLLKPLQFDKILRHFIVPFMFV